MPRNPITEAIVSLNRLRLEKSIEKLDIKDGDIVLFDSQAIDGSQLSELLVERYAAAPGAPKAWFFPVKVRIGKTIGDCVGVVSGATFKVIEREE